MLPGYVGPNVVDRPHKIDPALTLSQVEQYLLAFLLLVYHQRPTFASLMEITLWVGGIALIVLVIAAIVRGVRKSGGGGNKN